MRRPLATLVLALTPIAARAQATLAIEDVTVVPMDRARSIAHQTVVVRGDRIVALGPAASTRAPAGARRVDGRGKFLMPGLVDMHLHFVPGAGDSSDLAGQQVRLLLANGVTTARGLGGPPSALALRDRIRRGELLGPTLYVAGPSLNGRSVSGAEQARAMIVDQKAKGYDLLKTHGGIPRDVYDTIVAVARQQGLPLVGHVTPHVGLAHAIESGQQIEHLDGYIGAMVRDGAPVPPPPDQFPLDETLDYLDAAKTDAIVRETVARGIWNGPTIALFERAVDDSTPEQLRAIPEMRYIPAKVADAWAARRAQAQAQMPPADRRRQFVALRRDLVRRLHAAGAKLLAGSDSPQEFLVSGFSLHDELEALARAGLPAFAVLQATTTNPAEWLGVSSDVGTVAVGKRADLLLLDADPLADVRNTRKVASVVVRGRLVTKPELDAMLRW